MRKLLNSPKFKFAKTFVLNWVLFTLLFFPIWKYLLFPFYGVGLYPYLSMTILPTIFYVMGIMMLTLLTSIDDKLDIVNLDRNLKPLSTKNKYFTRIDHPGIIYEENEEGKITEYTNGQDY